MSGAANVFEWIASRLNVCFACQNLDKKLLADFRVTKP